MIRLHLSRCYLVHIQHNFYRPTSRLPSCGGCRQHLRGLCGVFLHLKGAGGEMSSGSSAGGQGSVDGEYDIHHNKGLIFARNLFLFVAKTVRTRATSRLCKPTTNSQETKSLEKQKVGGMMASNTFSEPPSLSIQSLRQHLSRS